MMHARDREEAFRIFMAIIAENLAATKPKDKLDSKEKIDEYLKTCARVAIRTQGMFDFVMRGVPPLKDEELPL